MKLEPVAESKALAQVARCKSSCTSPWGGEYIGCDVNFPLPMFCNCLVISSLSGEGVLLPVPETSSFLNSPSHPSDEPVGFSLDPDLRADVEE